jgi:hypothetical protein
MSLEDAADNVASYSNAIKSANALPSDRGVHAAEEAVMRTIPLVLITFVALSLSTSAARAGANGSWCANYGTGHSGIQLQLHLAAAMPRVGVGRLWFLHPIHTPERVTGQAGPGT